MGFFIVKPAYRGKGIGRKLWYQRRDTLLKRLSNSASIGMDGVVSMQPFYSKGGFEIKFRDERYEFIGCKQNYSKNISIISEKDYENILYYDKKCFGFEREKFIIPWLKQKEVLTFKYSENNSLRGFVIIRKAIQGYKICPLFADDFEIAAELFKACLDSVQGEQLFIDIPVINEDALKLIDEYNGKYIFECARMYYGKSPSLDINKVFGITTFELG